jgi:hypothetical protein
MRRLIYVPIIHLEADLGELAGEIEERAQALVGRESWQRHQEVVHLYWQRIADYWESRDVRRCKMFQDTMMINGAVGLEMVQHLANSGSMNYKLVDRLLARGAKLVKTEDPHLLSEEYALTRKLAEDKSFVASLQALLQYKWQKGKLLQARDAYIASSIDQNLGEQETGICFLGAHHQVVALLPADLHITYLKDPQKVKAYTHKYLQKKWERETAQLAEYLMAPIEGMQDGEDRA